MTLDEAFARIAGANIDFSAQLDLSNKDRWDIACEIGKTVSLLVNGYEDAFDAMDWEEAAREVHMDVKQGVQYTRNKILKVVFQEMSYCLEDYIA